MQMYMRASTKTDEERESGRGGQTTWGLAQERRSRRGVQVITELGERAQLMRWLGVASGVRVMTALDNYPALYQPCPSARVRFEYPPLCLFFIRPGRAVVVVRWLSCGGVGGLFSCLARSGWRVGGCWRHGGSRGISPLSSRD